MHIFSHGSVVSGAHMHILHVEVGRWPKHQVCTWSCIDGLNIRCTHAYSSRGSWQMAQTSGTRTFFTQKSADGPTPGTGMFFTWQIAQTLHTHIFHASWQMAQTPGTCLHTCLFFHMADGSNTRHTDECIVFT